MPTRKFQDTELNRLLAKGFTINQIASKLGVSGPAVRKRLRELEIVCSRETALHPGQAQKIAKNNFNAVDRLMALHESATDILTKLEAVFDGKADPSSLENILAGKVAPSELYHKLLAEVRKQLSLALEMQRLMCDIKEVQRFQEVVLHEIKQESSECQRRIVNRLVSEQFLSHSLALKN
jgi:DNA-binding Lrp family transcriptional regulator